MNQTQIQQLINNVKTTLGVEGIEMSELSKDLGEKYLCGKMNSQEVIEFITQYVKAKRKESK